MNIVFYSNNSNYFDSETFLINTLPSWREQFEELQKNHPEHTFYAVTQKPGMFLTTSDTPAHENVILYQTDNTEEIVSIIKKLNPDLAIALSFWTVPYDWLPVKDSLICERLRELGIKVICHPLETTMLCFNKQETHAFLEKYNINCAKALFVNHDLYFSADSKKEVRYNVYKEAVIKKLEKMRLPLIIKDPLGLSSYGMQLVNTLGEARAYLNSRKNNSDRIVEEYICGQQFGCEIYRAANGNCVILPPFKFSVNQYGITSPKQSVKFGPLFSDEDRVRYKLEDLYKMLSLLAEKLELCGPAQVDLVFDDEKWYVIEVNPRLSGMTTSYWCAYKEIFGSSPNMTSIQSDMTGELNFYDFILSMLSVIPMPQNTVISVPDTETCSYTLNIKFPILPEEKLQQLYHIPGVSFLCQTEDKAARQERETGYCEAIITGKTKNALLETLTTIESSIPEIIEPQFFNTAKKMIRQ
jgi:D-alanine-D-alanine ligase-like ATP-grasp enzyme